MKKPNEPKQQTGKSMTRRTVLTGATFIPLAAIATAQSPVTGATRITSLTVDQRQTLDAILGRLVPKDELGPGAGRRALHRS